jgi:hypothetical protein
LAEINPLLSATRRGFLLHDHTDLARFVEVRERDLSSFIGICANLSEAAMPAIGLRLGSDGFGFELITKRTTPAFYLDVTGHESKPAAFLDLIA